MLPFLLSFVFAKLSKDLICFFEKKWIVCLIKITSNRLSVFLIYSAKWFLHVSHGNKKLIEIKTYFKKQGIDIDSFELQVEYCLNHQNVGGMCFLKLTDSYTTENIQLLYIYI